NGEGDGIVGSTMHYFAGYYLINWYSARIYAYKTYIIQALKQLVEFNAIYEKNRFQNKGAYVDDDDFVAGTRGEFPIIVKENNMNYIIPLNYSAMCGNFLYQRDINIMILH